MTARQTENGWQEKTYASDHSQERRPMDLAFLIVTKQIVQDGRVPVFRPLRLSTVDASASARRRGAAVGEPKGRKKKLRNSNYSLSLSRMGLPLPHPHTDLTS